MKERDSRRHVLNELHKKLSSRLPLRHVRIKPLIIAITAMAVILLMLTRATSLFEANKTIPSFGSVKTVGVGVYWDSTLTNSVSTIDWGAIEPGSNSNVNVYIRNEGNSAITLTQNAANWNPAEASNYMTVTWNYGGQSIDAGEVVQVMMSLKISASIVGITDFSFDISIIGSG